MILLCVSAMAQNDKIRITGVIYDPGNKAVIPNLMVVNKRTQQGSFGNNSGKFDLEALKTDTIIIAATGFQTTRLCFNDSAYAPVYSVSIALKRLEYTLKPVEIFTKRDLEEIQKDIEKLGYEKEDYVLQGTAALESPITALYQAFSRRERNKRLVAEMRNNDRRRALLKELFRKYVDNDIITLDNDDFDDFIDFSNVSDDFMKSVSQYEFIMYIKKRFEVYQIVRNR
jgi:hypothetical protein